MAAASRVAVVAALVGNLIIALLKLGAGLVSGSSALLAEAAHSFSDTGNQVLLLVGLGLSKRPPTPRHPYGGGKSAYFWPLLVAVLLFGAAGMYSLIEGVDKLLHPHPVGDIRLGLGVLAAAFVIEAIVLAVALRKARTQAQARGITTIRQFLRENRDASLLTVIVEDSLALVGLPIAAAALVATSVTGNPLWDALGSITIAALLMGFALFLGYQVHGLILGRGLARGDLARVLDVLQRDPSVLRPLTVESMYLAPEVVLLGVTAEFGDDLTSDDLETAVARLEARLRDAVPALRFIYIEPGRPDTLVDGAFVTSPDTGAQQRS